MSYQPKHTWKTTTEPATEPITLAEAKKNASVDYTDDDAFIDLLIAASRESAEIYTRRKFITQTVTLLMDSFPLNRDHNVILIPESPGIAVTSIKYIDQNEVQQTLAASAYRVDVSSEPGRITPVFGTFWPTPLHDTNVVEVIFTAGYGDATKVPKSIKAAINLGIAGLYEHREKMSDIKLEENETWTDLLYKYRVLESF